MMPASPSKRNWHPPRAVSGYVGADDRKGLEHLLRYCARPAFALERLREIDRGHLVYESTKPGLGGSVILLLALMQLLDLLGELTPPRAAIGIATTACGHRTRRCDPQARQGPD